MSILDYYSLSSYCKSWIVALFSKLVRLKFPRPSDNSNDISRASDETYTIQAELHREIIPLDLKEKMVRPFYLSL